MKNLLIILLLCLMSCATKPLTQNESKVRILRKSDAPTNCIELGRVHSPGLASFSEQGRENNLKRATYKLQGNLVTITHRDDNNTIFGVAYKCK